MSAKRKRPTTKVTGRFGRISTLFAYAALKADAIIANSKDYVLCPCNPDYLKHPVVSKEEPPHDLRTDDENDDIEHESEPFPGESEDDHQSDKGSGAPAQNLRGFGKVDVEAVGDLIQNRMVEVERLRFKKLQELNEFIRGVVGHEKRAEKVKSLTLPKFFRTTSLERW